MPSFVNLKQEKVRNPFIWLDLYLLKIHGIEINNSVSQVLSRGIYKGEIVAIKRKSPETLSGFQELLRTTGISHPNIISIKTYIEETQSVVIEYVEGYEGAVTLQQFLEKQKQPISDQTRIKFMKQISSAMSHLHSKKILHRDLRASNILLTKNKDLKLTGD